MMKNVQLIIATIILSFFVFSCSSDRAERRKEKNNIETPQKKTPEQDQEKTEIELAQEAEIEHMKKEQLEKKLKLKKTMNLFKKVDLSRLPIDTTKFHLVGLNFMPWGINVIEVKNMMHILGMSQKDKELMRTQMSNPDTLWNLYQENKAIIPALAKIYEFKTDLNFMSEGMLVMLDDTYDRELKKFYKQSYADDLSGKSKGPYMHPISGWSEEHQKVKLGTFDVRLGFVAYTWIERRRNEGGDELVAMWRKIIRDYHESN